MSQAGSTSSVTLRDYVRVVWLRKWLVLIVVLVSVATAYAVSALQAPVYEATTLLTYQPPANVANPYGGSTTTDVNMGGDSARRAVARGYEFYKTHLLDDAGLPVPFARAQRMTLVHRDLYDYAEGISLGLLLAAEDRDAVGVASRLLSEVLDRWVLDDGHFATRETVAGRNTIPYHRWAQAQMFRALTLCAHIPEV